MGLGSSLVVNVNTANRIMGQFYLMHQTAKGLFKDELNADRSFWEQWNRVLDIIEVGLKTVEDSKEKAAALEECKLYRNEIPRGILEESSDGIGATDDDQKTTV